MKQDNIEKEIKISLNERNLYNKLLANTIKHKYVFVRDIYYDFGNELLRKQDKVIRVRRESKKCFFAYKGARSIDAEHVIKRIEKEMRIESDIAMDDILQSLGYYIRDIAEKKRKIIDNKKFPNLIIYLDLYPFIGKFIEVEGKEDEIAEFVKYYNITDKYLITRNCTELFEDYCTDNALFFHNIRCSLTFQKEKNLKAGKYEN